MSIRRIGFEQIYPVWRHQLWPDRQSAIETHSAMVWPFRQDAVAIDMEIFQYPVTFWGAFHQHKLIGVNSGHRTSKTEYRSRGLWVDPEYRGQGFAKRLLTMTEYQAMSEGTNMIWSIPRRSALAAYTSTGYMTMGEFFGTETSEANIYAVKRW